MVEKHGKYPVYMVPEERKCVASHKAMLCLTYEQILEIANVMYYVDKVSASLPGLFGGIRLDEKARSLHKSLHDAAVNCCLSLEEADRVEKEGGTRG